MAEDPEETARAALRLHQENAGMVIDDTPVHGDPHTAWKDEEIR